MGFLPSPAPRFGIMRSHLDFHKKKPYFLHHDIFGGFGQSKVGEEDGRPVPTR